MKIYEANLDGSGLKCLTPDAKVYTAEGSYSADGKKIVYSAGNAGNVQLFTMDADGKNAKQHHRRGRTATTAVRSSARTARR